MAKYSVSITADTTGTFVCNVVKKRSQPDFGYTIMAYGSGFGGGTVAWFVSPDAGTTLIAMTDWTDTAVSMTANKMFKGSLDTGSHNTDKLSIYVKMTGSTTPSVTAAVYDNNG